VLSPFVRDQVLFSRSFTEDQARRIEPRLYCPVVGIVIDSVRRVGFVPWGHRLPCSDTAR
jgi:hypothetical protein